MQMPPCKRFVVIPIRIHCALATEDLCRTTRVEGDVRRWNDKDPYCCFLHKINDFRIYKRIVLDLYLGECVFFKQNEESFYYGV